MSDEENKLTHMPEEFQDALKDLPEDKRKNIYRSFSMVMGGIIPQSNPIVDKLTKEHIADIIKNSENEAQRSHIDAKQNRICVLTIAIILIISFTVLVCVFRNHIQDIENLLTHLMTFVMGIAGGYGFAYKKINSEN